MRLLITFLSGVIGPKNSHRRPRFSVRFERSFQSSWKKKAAPVVWKIVSSAVGLPAEFAPTDSNTGVPLASCHGRTNENSGRPRARLPPAFLSRAYSPPILKTVSYTHLTLPTSDLV